jgi:hypothetical protein
MLKTLCLFSMFLLFIPSAYCDTETLVCQYPTYSDQDGNHPVKEKFIQTLIIDKENGKAYVLGNQGSDEVLMIKNKAGGRFTFMEVTPAGNVMTTTVDSKGNSVQSRNSVMFGELVPTQYYGRCVFK